MSKEERKRHHHHKHKDEREKKVGGKPPDVRPTTIGDSTRLTSLLGVANPAFGDAPESLRTTSSPLKPEGCGAMKAPVTTVIDGTLWCLNCASPFGHIVSSECGSLERNTSGHPVCNLDCRYHNR